MTLLSELIELVLPPHCVCCSRPGSTWCPSCQPPSVAAPVGVAHGPPTVAAGEYAAELRTALLHYKERGRRALAAMLAGYLADAVDVAARAGDDGRPAVLVPVPSRRAAARMRGGDHVLRLARAVGRQSGLAVRTPLRLSGPVLDSAGLNQAQRHRNLTGRMRALPPDRWRITSTPRVILLDDIVTTGATVAEADRALRVAGWSDVAAAVVAPTRLRHPPAASGLSGERADTG